MGKRRLQVGGEHKTAWFSKILQELQQNNVEQFLRLPLGLEAPVMTPNDATFLFFLVEQLLDVSELSANQ